MSTETGTGRSSQGATDALLSMLAERIPARLGATAVYGYIELKEGRSRFVPIVHPARMLALICGAVLAGLILLRPPAGRQQRTSRMPWR